MSAIEKIKQELQDVETLGSLSSALLEIASTRIVDLKNRFETNGIFYEDVSNLYRLVEFAAKKQQYTKGTIPIDTRPSIHVAVTSNKRFHGILNKKVINSFVESINEGDNVYLVIGFTGKHLLEGTEHEKKCQYTSFIDDYPTPKEMEVFLKRVAPYGNVFLHFPKFINIFRQDPEMVDITFSSNNDDSLKITDSNLEQIYEPELPHILKFFESQVRQLLFTRIMLESELSRTAARLVKMNTTHDRADSIIHEKKLLLRKDVMILEDIRLLETFVSRVKWKVN